MGDFVVLFDRYFLNVRRSDLKSYWHDQIGKNNSYKEKKMDKAWTYPKGKNQKLSIGKC